MLTKLLSKALTAVLGIAIMLCSSNAAAKDVALSISTPGSLRQSLIDSDADGDFNLKLSGTLNADDLSYLSSATGLLAHILELDLSGTDFILDGSVYAETSVPTGSMGVNEIDHYRLWPRDSVSGYYTLNGWVTEHWGNNLAGEFRGCKFEKVVLPPGLEGIGVNAFYEAENLREVVFGGNERYLADNAFRSATKLSEIHLPASLDSIGNNTFHRAGSDTGFSLDLSGVSKFGFKCFSESGIKCLTLPHNAGNMPEEMFSGCSRLEEVSVPEDMVRIPRSMFRNCPSLQRLSLSEGLTHIEDYAFSQCDLRELSLPSSLSSIGAQAFSGNKNLEKVNAAEGIERIFTDSFKGSIAEKEFPVENGVKYFGHIAYHLETGAPLDISFRSGTRVLAGNLFCEYVGKPYNNYACEVVESVILPDELEHIGDDTFRRCRKLTSIAFPPKLKSIGKSAFAECSGLTSINLPSALEEIGDMAFMGTSVGNLDFPGSLTRIGAGAFKGCSMTSVELPSNLLELGTSAFYGTKISSVTLPESIRVIGFSPFGNIPELVTVRYNCINAEVKSDYWPNFYPLECQYGLVAGSGCDRLSFGPNVKSIPERAFMQSIPNINKISLPEGLEAIGPQAFSGTNLEVANMPASLLYIGDYSFYNTKLKEIEVPENVAYLGDGAFGGIEELMKIEFRAHHAISSDIIVSTQFGPKRRLGVPFSDSGCSELVIGPDVAYIMPMLFQKSSYASFDFKSVVIPDGCTIGEAAFQNCISLRRAVLPSDITEIPDNLFNGCYNLSDVNLPQTVTRVGDHAFYRCPARGFVLPPALTSIGQGAFCYCDAFGTNLSIGPSVAEIGKGAFAGCRSVERIFIPENVSFIGEGAFNVYPDADLYNRKVVSMLRDPSSVCDENGPFLRNGHWTVRIPYGTEDDYRWHSGWDGFGNYEVNDDMTLSSNTVFTADFSNVGSRDLDGVCIGGVFYSTVDQNIFTSDYDGTYFLILTNNRKPTDCEIAALDSADPLRDDLCSIFDGISLKLPKGWGTVEITSLSTGSGLMAKIAGREPVWLTGNPEMTTTTLHYDVDNDSYLFISSLSWTRINQLSVHPNPDSVDGVNDDSSSTVVASCSIDGTPVSNGFKGIVIERRSDGSVRKTVRR